MLETKTPQTKSNNPIIITLPEGKIIDSSADNKYLAHILATELDLDHLYECIAPVQNIEAAVEIVSYLINNLSKTKNAPTNIQATITKLFNNYKYEDLINNKLLKKYNIKKLSEKEFTYSLDQKLYKGKILPSNINNLSSIESPLEKPFLKINAMSTAVITSIKNKHEQTAEKLIRDVLKTADICLKLFSQHNNLKYHKSTEVMSSFIFLLEPESQIYAFKALKEHWHQKFDILTHFSNFLLSKNYFDKVVEFLEPELINIDDKVLIDESISGCYYNLGLAYYCKVNYQLAKECYLSALKYLPNDQDTILELFKVYARLHETENLKNIINKLQSKDIKSLLEMSIDSSSVSTKGLKSINKNALPKILDPLITTLKYIAKYNENRFASDKDKISEFKKLFKLNDNILLLTTAVYTQQFDFAKEIIQKFSSEEIFQSKIIWEYKTLLESKADYESTQSIIEKSGLQGTAAAEIINTTSTVLIANNDFTVVSKNVGKALEYDSKNEDSLELGIAAALLNNDKEKVKEYASQLSEDKQQEIAANYSKDSEAENIEELIEQYDPREIHAHFQRIKQQKLVEAGQKITNTKVISSWKIGEQEVKKDNATFIGKYKGLNCFTKISDEIEKKLDNGLVDSFARAIKKGIIYHKAGINGVKFLKNKVVEVKIDGDMRLFTNIIHKNSQEDLFINFDHYGNHNEVENFANSHHLEILGNMDIYY